MKLTIDFYCGLARRLSRETSTVIEVSDHATLREVCAALAERFPTFLGPLIVPETYDLVEPHFFNINGRHAASLEVVPKEGDRVFLMAITAGG